MDVNCWLNGWNEMENENKKNNENKENEIHRIKRTKPKTI